ncbi:MAG TPA: helix-turn-helix domain-containing protein, partial [Cellvibrio sp.]
DDLGLSGHGTYSQSPTHYSQKPNLLEAAQVIGGPVEIIAPAVEPHHQPSPGAPAYANNAYRTSQFSVGNLAGDNIALISNTPVHHSSLNNPALGNDLKQREYEIIMNTLRIERGSRKNTAERLGISARTLRYKIARLREEGYEITE